MFSPPQAGLGDHLPGHAQMQARRATIPLGMLGTLPVRSRCRSAPTDNGRGRTEWPALPTSSSSKTGHPRTRPCSTPRYLTVERGVGQRPLKNPPRERTAGAEASAPASCDRSAESERSGERFAEAVFARREDAELAVAMEAGIGAGSADDGERPRLFTLGRSSGGKVRVEQDRERPAAVIAGERLPDGLAVIEDAAVEGAATADELVDERP